MTTEPITYLTVSDVAECLRASRKTILRRIRAKRLPAIAEGRRHLIDPRDLEAYIEHLRDRQVLTCPTMSTSVPDNPKARQPLAEAGENGGSHSGSE